MNPAPPATEAQDVLAAATVPVREPARAGAPPMRILMVTPRYLPDMGGIETHVREVSRRLAAAGHSVTVVAADRTRTRPRTEEADGVSVRRVPAWPRGRDYYFAPGVWREIMASDCDLIHIQGCHTLVAPSGMLAALRKGVPFVITFHSGGHSSSLRNRLRGLQWAALGGIVRRAARWVAVSRFEADLFSAKMRLPRSEMIVVPNGAQLPSGARVDAGGPGEPLIVSVGRLERYKGHHRAIQAMPRILRRVPGAKLRILGEGPYKEELVALAGRLGLEGSVEIGGIPPSERSRLAAVLGAASLVVLLSEYEAHPVAVLEALALGRRVLVTDCSGFMEMVEAGAVGAVAPDASDAQVADAILAALGSERAPSPAALPDWQDCADRLEEVYRSVRPCR